MKNMLHAWMLTMIFISITVLISGCSVEKSEPESGQQEEAESMKEQEPRLVWHDEFDYEGLPDPQKWDYDVGGHGWGNNEEQYYTRDRLENAVVKDGKLIITARKEEYGGKDYTSARLVTRGKAGWLYGRIEVKAKIPSGRGTWPAIWMLPVENLYGQWPNSGEIDIMEHVGFDPGLVHASIHTGKYNHIKGTQRTATTRVDDYDEEFHVYAVEWRPGRMDFFVDENKYMTTSFNSQMDAYDGVMAWPFDRKFYLILNIAVGGNWGGAKGIDDSIFPKTMEIDYVRVYDYGFEPAYDKKAPSKPEGLALVESNSGYTLKWKASTDDYAVSHYIVEMDGKEYRSCLVNWINIGSLKAGQKHKFKVIAVDYNGNRAESEITAIKVP